MNTEALLALIGDLYAQNAIQAQEIQRLGAALAEAQQKQPEG